jgi:putative flippase GtrA
VVIPVYNEETDLAPSVHQLHAHLVDHFPYPFRITIADNASTDRTWSIAQALAGSLPEVAAEHLDAKGRGRALRHVWQSSDATVLAYMDVDLSTDLAALFPLVAPLLSGHSDLAIGTRLSPDSRVVRGPKREFISRSYNLLLRASLSATFSDAQCGFKAIRGDVARHLLPMVEDTGWFFDTEILVLAERAGLRIHEVPVDWVDDPDSRVDIVRTALDDIKGIVRVARTLAKGDLPLHTLLDLTRGDTTGSGTERVMANGGGVGSGSLTTAQAPVPAHSGVRGIPAGLPWQLISFATIGVVSTLAYAMLFWLARTGLSAQTANLVALLLTAVANTAANRKLTFGVSGRAGAGRHQFQGLLVFALGLALTSGSLALLHMVTATPARAVELSVLVVANLVATVSRFLLMREWIFRRARFHGR